ncbi:MAG: excalibur calcium-binding domain-containing protein [Croceibacterium sp.]
MKFSALFPIAVVTAVVPLPVAAHGGGLNAEGCHTNRTTADYHCHRTANRPQERQVARSPQSAFRNCTEARAAGAAPVRRGQPGYGRHLDRDGDGVGCE